MGDGGGEGSDGRLAPPTAERARRDALGRRRTNALSPVTVSLARCKDVVAVVVVAVAVAVAASVPRALLPLQMHVAWTRLLSADNAASPLCPSSERWYLCRGGECTGWLAKPFNDASEAASWACSLATVEQAPSSEVEVFISALLFEGRRGSSITDESMRAL